VTAKDIGWMPMLSTNATKGRLKGRVGEGLVSVGLKGIESI